MSLHAASDPIEPRIRFLDDAGGTTSISSFRHESRRHAAAAATDPTSLTVAYWNASAAVAAQNLTYEGQAVAFALQGLVNDQQHERQAVTELLL